MSRSSFEGFSTLLQRLECVMAQVLGIGRPPQPPVAMAVAGVFDRREQFKMPIPGAAKLDNSILWAVPKHRRTVEKRLNRKFGWPEYNWKPLKAKTNLRSCNQCGHDHEVGILCPHCYQKVLKETQEMQDKIQEKLGLSPVEQEVVVLYEGEKSDQLNSVEGKRIVEMQKPRPLWFTKNLMQRTTQQPATTKEVKPSDLG